MKRRTSVMLAAGVLVVAGVVIGSVVAFGLGGGGVARPSGDETILSIEPAEQKVSCGPEPVTIKIFLDDLAARPSPRTPDVSYGATSFEFLLRYDPDIVRIAHPIDVQINPGLSLEDADGDGLARSFFLASDIDGFAGEALLAGASFVPGGASPADNFEEGLDPVARGQPLLLLTVRFQTVGHGTTVLTLREPEELGVFDPSVKRYEPVVVRDASLTVEGGDCPPPPPATPRPTPKPTSTPLVPPTSTPVVWRTVTAPEAAAAGRPDCPEGWLAYSDPEDRYSICYPADFAVTVSELALNVRNPRDPGQQENLFTVVVSWSEASPYAITGEPSPETCPEYVFGMGHISSTFVELTLSGRAAPACFWQGATDDIPPLPLGSLHGAIPFAEDGSERGGFIHFRVDFSGPDVSQVPALGQAIIDTLSINYR